MIRKLPSAAQERIGPVLGWLRTVSSNVTADDIEQFLGGELTAQSRASQARKLRAMLVFLQLVDEKGEKFPEVQAGCDSVRKFANCVRQNAIRTYAAALEASDDVRAAWNSGRDEDYGRLVRLVEEKGQKSRAEANRRISCFRVIREWAREEIHRNPDTPMSESRVAQTSSESLAEAPDSMWVSELVAKVIARHPGRDITIRFDRAEHHDNKCIVEGFEMTTSANLGTETASQE